MLLCFLGCDSFSRGAECTRPKASATIYGACAVSRSLHLVLLRSCGLAVERRWTTCYGRAWSVDFAGRAIHKRGLARGAAGFRARKRIKAGAAQPRNNL